MKKKSSGKKAKLRRFISFIKKALLLYFVLTILWVIACRFFNPPITWLMTQRGIARMIDGKGWKMEKKWRSFDELSYNLKLAAVAGEDANFLNHWGFDVNSIQKAYLRNKEGKPYAAEVL
jgi:monofunctional biosynthetic peptidoglycan transglycosylase